MTEAIPHYILERGRRATARRIAAALVRGMADTDASFESIANRIGRDPAAVRQWLHDFIDGKTNGADLDQCSDFALGMACELEPQVRPCQFLEEHYEAEAQRAAA